MDHPDRPQLRGRWPAAVYTHHVWLRLVVAAGLTVDASVPWRQAVSLDPTSAPGLSNSVKAAHWP